MLMNILKKLNWYHIGFILILPIILVLINPNWIFNLSKMPGIHTMVDDYIYTGYQLAYPKYIGWFPADTHYFIDRINWILPIYGLHQIFSPTITHLIVHFTLYYSVMFTFYTLVHKLTQNRRIAIVIVILFGQYPLIMRSLGWNYPDGYVLLWFVLTLLLLTYATHSRYRAIYLVASGITCLMMITAHFFNVFYAPVFAIYFFFLDHLFEKPIRLVKVALLVSFGMVVAYVPLSLLQYHLMGQFLFHNTINMTGYMSSLLPQMLMRSFSGMLPFWHLLLMIITFVTIQHFLKSRYILLGQQPHIGQSVISAFLASYLVILVWLLLGYYYTHVSFYHANNILTGCLLLAFLLSSAFQQLDEKQFQKIVAMAFILPMMPFIFVTFIPSLINPIVLYPIPLLGVVWAWINLSRKRQPFQLATSMVLLMVFSTILIGDSPMIQTYHPIRGHEVVVYEETVEMIHLLNSRYNTISPDDFRFIFDFDDTKMSTFQALGASYLWLWDRRYDLSQDKLDDNFLNTNSIIVLSSLETLQHTLDKLQQFRFRQPDEQILIGDDIMMLFFDSAPFTDE